MTTPSDKLTLTGPFYDFLKFIALVLLPGVGAMYFGLAQIWGLPAAEQVIGTITTFDVFLGLLLKKSSMNYDRSEKDVMGDVVYEQYPNGEIAGMRLVAKYDPFIMTEGDFVKFKVLRQAIPEPSMEI